MYPPQLQSRWVGREDVSYRAQTPLAQRFRAFILEDRSPLESTVGTGLDAAGDSDR